ncbi:MAG: bifunctional oligoribonuclease/PAP phosphatase NrnA [Candidatus Nanosynbacter sp.]
MASQSQKQQIIQSIKDVTNILVTVSADPSVDELSAALGLTIFLNKLGKHATAVFSGKVPPAISFLEPDETFEATADSLRDFIIALDKEKADHLRYKVVDDAVKIFITPYRATITEADLEFSQGDYNIELVLALNVESQDHLDKALTAHGKILHDAVVSTVTAGMVRSSLGTVDWHDNKASGVSEMLVDLIDELRTPKVTMDEQIATALLTGVVAATERFSNNLTSSRVMTLAAELMAVGANQQLIATKLAEGQAIKAEEHSELEQSKQAADAADDKTDDDDGQDGANFKVERGKRSEPAESKRDDGALSISHERRGSLDDVAKQTRAEEQDAAARAATAQLDRLRAASVTSGRSSTPSTSQPISASVSAEPETATPLLGGTLNATTERAAEDKRRDLDTDQNKTILHHGTYVGASRPALGESPLNAAMGKSDEPPSVDPFATTNKDEAVIAALKEETQALADKQTQPAAPPSLPDSERDARAAITEALAAAPPLEPAASPAPVVSSSPLPTVSSAPATLADIESNVMHGLPPLPDFSDFSGSGLPPLPPAPVGTADGGLPALNTSPSAPSTPAQPRTFNPSQFQIPGQK